MPQGNEPSVMLDLASAVPTQLDSCLADTRRVVLVEYPEHHNVGDNAIWVATIAYLRSRGIAVTHSTNHRLYDVATVRRKLSSDAAILLLGGGNFGDLWPESHRLREARGRFSQRDDPSDAPVRPLR